MQSCLQAAPDLADAALRMQALPAPPEYDQVDTDPGRMHSFDSVRLEAHRRPARQEPKATKDAAERKRITKKVAECAASNVPHKSCLGLSTTADAIQHYLMKQSILPAPATPLGLVSNLSRSRSLKKRKMTPHR